ncbi:5317_t:CDS:2 [Ambispora gerdemannii]|uniref:5317_t:CDS:1 n=1 Tax=Ambispora gerdemannii TaxID=144530 RepID=A0A9N8ZXZ0_9GLOM|nr:5317_t:CDS:2 [Ambispora gerdemannii]
MASDGNLVVDKENNTVFSSKEDKELSTNTPPHSPKQSKDRRRFADMFNKEKKVTANSNTRRITTRSEVAEEKRKKNRRRQRRRRSNPRTKLRKRRSLNLSEYDDKDEAKLKQKNRLSLNITDLLYNQTPSAFPSSPKTKRSISQPQLLNIHIVAKEEIVNPQTPLTPIDYYGQESYQNPNNQFEEEYHANDGQTKQRRISNGTTGSTASSTSSTATASIVETPSTPESPISNESNEQKNLTENIDVLEDERKSPRWHKDWKQGVGILDVIEDTEPISEEANNGEQQDKSEANAGESKFTENSSANDDIVEDVDIEKSQEFETNNNSLSNTTTQQLETKLPRQSEQTSLSTMETVIIRQLELSERMEKTMNRLESKVNEQREEMNGMNTIRMQETIQRLETKVDAQRNELDELRQFIGDLRKNQKLLLSKEAFIHYQQLPPNTIEFTTSETGKDDAAALTLTTDQETATSFTLVKTLVVNPLYKTVGIASSVFHTLYIQPVVVFARIVKQTVI